MKYFRSLGSLKNFYTEPLSPQNFSPHDVFFCLFCFVYKLVTWTRRLICHIKMHIKPLQSYEGWKRCHTKTKRKEERERERVSVARKRADDRPTVCPLNRESPQEHRRNVMDRANATKTQREQDPVLPTKVIISFSNPITWACTPRRRHARYFNPKPRRFVVTWRTERAPLQLRSHPSPEPPVSQNRKHPRFAPRYYGASTANRPSWRRVKTACFFVFFGFRFFVDAVHVLTVHNCVSVPNRGGERSLEKAARTLAEEHCRRKTLPRFSHFPTQTLTRTVPTATVVSAA